jgi:predicted glycoside hydrolase/deacetylase ChbG (UPF0249 family)
MIIINADDWGCSKIETDVALCCYRDGIITSVSAMVFMEDSDRAAIISKDEGIDTGLHLNLSLSFTGKVFDGQLQEYQNRILRFLMSSKYSLLVYHPLLRKQFQYVYKAQVEEFCRLFGKPPSHINGHHHLHLCSNMLMDRIITKGEKVRRSFSFQAGEKNIFNRVYRRLVDRHLAAKFRVTDYFFDLPGQYKKDRLKRVSLLSRGASVELMTHPVVPEELSIMSDKNYLDAIKTMEMGTYALL